MKKFMAMMLSIAVMAMSGNEMKAQTNDTHQDYQVTGSLTSSSHKKLHKDYNVEIFRLSDGKSDFVAYGEVKGNDMFKFNLHTEGAYKVKVVDKNGNLVMSRVFAIDQDHPTLEIGQYDVATGKRVPVSALQANKDK